MQTKRSNIQFIWLREVLINIRSSRKNLWKMIMRFNYRKIKNLHRKVIVKFKNIRNAKMRIFCSNWKIGKLITLPKPDKKMRFSNLYNLSKIVEKIIIFFLFFYQIIILIIIRLFTKPNLVFIIDSQSKLANSQELLNSLRINLTVTRAYWAGFIGCTESFLIEHCTMELTIKLFNISFLRTVLI